MTTPLWDSIYNDVLTITNRPELDAETNIGVRQGTLRAHLCEQFPRDLQYTTIINTDQSQSFTDLVIPTNTNQFTRFRNIKTVQIVDVNGVVQDFPQVNLVEVDDIYEYDYPGIKRQRIAWLAGININVHVVDGAYGAFIGWYQSPNLDTATYDSWIASVYPDVIVWEAAMFIWNRTGNDGRASEAYKVLHGDPRLPNSTGLYHELKASYLTTAGR